MEDCMEEEFLKLLTVFGKMAWKFL